MTLSDKNTPLISVILPVHNGEAYLAEAIESILKQTYTNFELIILSTADTSEASLSIIQNFNDPRIHHIRRTPDLACLPAALNRGIDLARGIYIARMDADDIALPRRFETEIAFMEKHPEIGIVGSYAKTIGRNTGTIMRHPLHHEEIRANLLFHSSMIHPTVLMRKKTLDDLNLRYNPTLEKTEDYEFWYRASKTLRIANIPKILLLYRTHEGQATYREPEKQTEVRNGICADAFGKLGIPFSSEEKIMYEHLRQYRKASSPEELAKVSKWFIQIESANETKHIYDRRALKQLLGQEWLTYCRLSAGLGRVAWQTFWRSEVRSWIKKDPKTLGRLLKFYFATL